MRRAWLVLVVVVVVAACGDERAAQEGPRRSGNEAVGGRVVATVDGVGIRVADVERVVRETGLSKEDALRRLEEQELLAAEAERRGFEDDPEARIAARRALVQAFLEREVERAITPESMSDEAVRARWRDAERFHRPERRTSRHVLARLSESATPAQERAARAIAQEALDALRGGEDVDAVMARYRHVTRDGIEVLSEDLGPQGPDAPLAEPYLSAMFALDAPGVVPHPVRTSFGWHAIVVTDIEPAVEVPFEEAEEELRRQLVTERRRARVDALYEELRESHPVELDEARVRELLAQDILEGS